MKVERKNKDLKINHSDVRDGQRETLRGPQMGISFFQLLHVYDGDPVDITGVLVSFSCYSKTLSSALLTAHLF